MNERIRELAVQACITIVPEPFDDASRSWNDTMEKFAELIVKECARVVDIWSDEVPCSEGYDKFTVGKLKQYFGVEE